MVYTLDQGVIKKNNSRLAIAAIAAALLTILTAAIYTSVSALPVSGPGNVKVGVNAQTWESNLYYNPPQGLYGIKGSGQVNGEFTTAERNGVVVGLRAQDRFNGVIVPTYSDNGKVGFYGSTSSGATVGDSANWNIDWTIDLRSAKGIANNKTLADYDISLETNAFNSWFGFLEPVDLKFGVLPNNAVLYQSSQNPSFGNDDFNPSVPGAYDFRLVLTPKTFNGPALATAIVVNVVEE